MASQNCSLLTHLHHHASAMFVHFYSTCTIFQISIREHPAVRFDVGDRYLADFYCVSYGQLSLYSQL